MAKAKKTTGRNPVSALRHKDKRANIPTRELRDFVAEAETRPAGKQFEGLLYARDPSLDPQLVWKGKDEQDRKPLEVPVVPVYIQEKIHPQAIVEEVRRRSRKQEEEPVANLFADFNGIKFDELVDFYHHEQNWSNRIILGDSLLVMTSLAEKEGLKGKVQMIYIDPPYGIKFGSNWQVSTRKRNVKDGEIESLTRQPEQIRAFRDTWEFGVHSYLNYLRDRLVVARELLTETGSIFVQIGNRNAHLVRCVLDEVFGGENHIATICFQKTGSTDEVLVQQTIDYLLFYAKHIEIAKYRQLYQERARGSLALDRYDLVIEQNGNLRRLTPGEERAGEFETDAVRAQLTSLTSARPVGKGDLREVVLDGIVYTPGTGTFKTDQHGMNRLVTAGRVRAAGSTLRYLRRIDDFPVVPLNDRWESVQLGTGLTYVVQTSPKVIERSLLMTTDPGDLVLDPTCGSGTTAYVAEQWGRRWITIDTSRVALSLARTRLMAARYPYYLLADSPEGLKKEAEITGHVPPTPSPRAENDIRRGFVYERVPHVTLKSIANNEEVDVIHAQFRGKLDPLRARLSADLKQTWEEWQVPREAEPNWPEATRALHSEWWDLRLQRQKEIDISIARRADVEFLYDQPYEDNKRVRVSGPFTVESLSPHRVLAVDDESPGPAGNAEEAGRGQFTTMIIENLYKAGVQNTRRNERLTLERLEPFAGQWIHADGEFKEKSGATRRVAVSIGPEHGTVGSEMVKEAAKEALKGRGFDLLVVCGFAFDAHADETAAEFMPVRSEKQFAVAHETRQFGKLPVLLARMNPDLTMGDEVLKKTGSGNLFMVFGEPDLAVAPGKDGKIVVTIQGVDVYDPTTGQIRSSTTDEIACWFLDTEYNGESFFVRHAYFTGGDEPYDKLKRALRAEIDEAAWSALYTTKSLPFDRPATGKIAVKVINHYGDEVLKIYEV